MTNDFLLQSTTDTLHNSILRIRHEIHNCYTAIQKEEFGCIFTRIYLINDSLHKKRYNSFELHLVQYHLNNKRRRKSHKIDKVHSCKWLGSFVF